MMSYIEPPVIPTEYRDEIKAALREIEAMDPDADSMAGPLIEQEFGQTTQEDDVELRLFPTGPDGAEQGVTEIYVAVTVRESHPHHQTLGMYSPDNLRNGGEYYEALDDDIKSLVSEVFGEHAAQNLDLVAEKGSRAAVGTVAFR